MQFGYRLGGVRRLLGLRRSLAGAFDKAVSSWFDNASEEHGLTDDGKTVAPILTALRFKIATSRAMQTSRHQSVTHNQIHTGRLRWRGHRRGA